MARINKNHLNQPDRAIHYYQEFLKRHQASDDTRASVLMEVARVYREQDQTERAIETYQQIIDDFSSISQVEESYYNLGEIYLDREQYDQAVSTFRKLLEAFPDGNLQDGALFQLAKAYQGAGEYGNQLEAYQRLLENHPESDLHEYTLYLTVQLAAKQTKRDVALKWAKVYREKYSEGQYLGRIYDIVESTWGIDLESS